MFSALLVFPMLVISAKLYGQEDILGNLSDGLRCCIQGQHPTGTSELCATAPLATGAYITLSGMYNVLMLLTIAHASAAQAALASTIVLPLSNILLASPTIMGEHAATLSAFDIGALLIILLGVAIFRLASSERPGRVVDMMNFEGPKPKIE